MSNAIPSVAQGNGVSIIFLDKLTYLLSPEFFFREIDFTK